jgi:2-polyprenyl-3-methyl-5-hydroxy-6-metoxy-1,4-benzoquinol methylase
VTWGGFAQRSTAAELMDTEVVPFEAFRHCLVDLERINRLTLGYRPTLGFLARAFRAAPRDRPMVILDAGSGHGDMLRRIWRMAARRGVAVRLEGVDLNPWSAKAARLATPPEAPIVYETADIFSLGPERRPDVIISALFAHHLADEALVRLIAWMEATAAAGWFINDLHRHPIPYHFIRHAARLSSDRFIRHDAPVSVARAFVRADWTRLLADAGIAEGEVRIRWHVPFRWGVGRLR